MRENRTYGSEGGGAQLNAPSLPLSGKTLFAKAKPVVVRGWKSQISISNPTLKMGLRKGPPAFTEPGVAMLFSVLPSERGVEVPAAFVYLFTMLHSIQR